MTRQRYTIFSKGRIGNLTLPNRLVRSATWDPSILRTRKMSHEVLDLYRRIAQGGVGMIITGDFPVVPDDMYEGEDAGVKTLSYDDIRIDGLGELVNVVHESAFGCKIVAQLSRGYGPGPSKIPSPFLREEELLRPLTTKEVDRLIDCFVDAILWMKEEGFDGAQLHAAHGGLLSQFLSPYANRRDDAYGGSIQNRARIVTQIISRAKEKVDDFPILIKMNCTDYVEGGIDIANFPELAKCHRPDCLKVGWPD
jgi:2,4-dienoyl-CoA reductase-like NADH-dependent reductase (Old Yellow Enzyme family)